MSSTDTNIRQVVVDELEPRLKGIMPRRRGSRPGWQFLDTQRSVDTFQVPTVILRQVRIEREPTQPRQARRAYFELVVASPLEDTGKAEHDLDDLIVDVLGAVDAVPGAVGLVWTTCTKGVWSDEYPAPAYVIELWTPYLIQKGT
jgi:hypothetical protein